MINRKQYKPVTINDIKFSSSDLALLLSELKQGSISLSKREARHDDLIQKALLAGLLTTTEKSFDIRGIKKEKSNTVVLNPTDLIGDITCIK